MNVANLLADNTDRSGECWEWTGRRNEHGYGRVTIDGRQFYAHRLAVVGLSDGQVVRHKCDNPPCVNPDHLVLGTQADNVRDMHDRGRSRVVAVSGLSHHAATVSPDQIRAAVSAYLSGNGTQASHAAGLGVSQSTFGRWVRGEGRPDRGLAGVVVGKSRRPGVALKPCGTRAAYERHRRHGDKPCQTCGWRGI